MYPRQTTEGTLISPPNPRRPAEVAPPARSRHFAKRVAAVSATAPAHGDFP
ncbi:MAG TPA: hypothetical protein PLY67_06225 [Clostridiales bacterium]|nr:hypothetical protein [Clostridiales bacterium]